MLAGGILKTLPADVLKQIGNMSALKPEDIEQSAMFLLSTPYKINITELTIKPVGEKCDLTPFVIADDQNKNRITTNDCKVPRRLIIINYD